MYQRWNLKKKSRIERDSDTENVLLVASWEEGRGMGEKGEVIRNYKLVVTE